MQNADRTAKLTAACVSTESEGLRCCAHRLRLNTICYLAIANTGSDTQAGKFTLVAKGDIPEIVCTPRRRLKSPIVRAFWDSLSGPSS